MKYTKQTIEKAKRMYQSGKYSLREICDATGIKSPHTVLFHANPEARKKIIERTRDWMKRNPERWNAIMEKANRKFKQAHGK